MLTRCPHRSGSIHSAMKRFLHFLIVFLLTVCLIIYPAFLGWSSASPAAPDLANGVVTLDGKPLFLIREPFASTSAQQRAVLTRGRLEQFASNSDLSIASLQIKELNGAIAIMSGEMALITITSADAKAAKSSEYLLAQNYLRITRQAVEAYRQERTPENLFRAAMVAIAAVLLFLLAFFLLRWGFAHIVHRLRNWRGNRIRGIRLQNLEIVSAHQIIDWLVGGVLIVRSLLSLGLIAAVVAYVANLFPTTRQISNLILGYFRYGLNAVWLGFLGYLPNLLIILATILVSYYLIRFLKLISLALGRRTISIAGFYPEWAEPTYKLLALVVTAIALAVIFPHLPGFGSPAFQGISIFFGVLLSLGSSSAISNLIAGFILIYTRAFRLGDFVKVNDIEGTVEDKTIFVTRVRTPNNTIVTIPNSTLLSSNIINYSTTVEETQRPLLLHTTVTLGYDVPWREIHSTLIAAALATPRILSEPQPFVLQTGLNDFYVSYELKAYTSEPTLMAQIYSDLHQSIQDKCNEAGIEICSPHYSALRDGNHTTIPQKYLEVDYTAPGFRVEQDVEGNGEGKE
jgi:small-conductance mechanosensitive channel